MDFKDTKLEVAKKFSAEFSWQLYIVFKSKNMPFFNKSRIKRTVMEQLLDACLNF